METVGQACRLNLTSAIEGELPLTFATVTSPQRQARLEASLHGVRSEVHPVDRKKAQYWSINGHFFELRVSPANQVSTYANFIM